MTLVSTLPLTEISIRNLPGGKRREACKTDNLTDISKPIVWKMWEPRRLTALWASTRIVLPYLYIASKCGM
jgi:hypothetical protein